MSRARRAPRGHHPFPRAPQARREGRPHRRPPRPPRPRRLLRPPARARALPGCRDPRHRPRSLLRQDEPWIATFLESAPVRGKKTLADTVAEWIVAGRQLEDIEHEREEHLARQAVPATKANIQAARSQWFRVVTTLLNNLDLSKAPPEAIEAIRGPVLRASDRAAKRYTTGNLDTPILEPDAEAGDPTDQPPPEKKPAAEKKPVG